MIEDYSVIDFEVPECVKGLNPDFNHGKGWSYSNVSAFSDGRRLDFIKPNMIAECYISAPYYDGSSCTAVEKVDDKGFYLTNGNYVLWEQIGLIKVSKPSGNSLGIRIFEKYGSRAFDKSIPEDAREGLCSEFNDCISFLREKEESSFHEWELD